MSHPPPAALPSIQGVGGSPSPRPTEKRPARLSHRLPPISSAAPPQVALSKMELCGPRLIEVALRDYDWEAHMEPFFRTTTPLFEGFRDKCTLQQTAGGSTGAGRGFDIQMHTVHSEFLEVVLSIIRSQFDEMGYTEEKFIAAVLARPTETASKKLLGFLDGLADFATFGEMMEDSFSRMYGSTAAHQDRSIGGMLRPPCSAPLNSLTAGHRELVSAPAPAAGPAVGAVRVLWDIENVNVRKKEGGIKVVTKLNNFLESKRLRGPGIDLRVTAFFNPSNGAVSKHTVNDLDKAAVELVWVSSKREDADRKLGMRINQDMQVLPPSTTTFVIITSDQDFRHHFQLLQNAGYRVIVLHDANPGKWEQALSMHCTESYVWSRDVLLQGEAPAAHSERVDQSNRNGARVVHTESEKGGTIAPFPLTDDQWYQGVCKAWKGKFGFVTTKIGGLHSVHTSDVYVSTVILPPECRGVLTTGEKVLLKVKSTTRGLRATEIQSGADK